MDEIVLANGEGEEGERFDEEVLPSEEEVHGLSGEHL